MVSIFGGFICLNNEKKRKPQKTWCKNWLKIITSSVLLCLYLSVCRTSRERTKLFTNFMRVAEDYFEVILRRVFLQKLRKIILLWEEATGVWPTSIYYLFIYSLEHFGRPHSNALFYVVCYFHMFFLVTLLWNRFIKYCYYIFITLLLTHQ